MFVYLHVLNTFSFVDMADADQRREFLEEIQLMKAVGSHKNIVNMLGCCTVEEPMFLLVEYIPYGYLLHYLRKRRGKVESSTNISNIIIYLTIPTSNMRKTH